MPVSIVVVTVLSLIIGAIIGVLYAKRIAQAEAEGFRIANNLQCHKDCKTIINNTHMDGLQKFNTLCGLEKPWANNPDALATIARYKDAINPSIRLSAEEDALLGNQIH